MPYTPEELWPDETLPFSRGWTPDTKDYNTGIGYWGQNATLRDFWDANPLYTDEDGMTHEFRLGPYTFLIPPDAIAVDQYYGVAQFTGPTLRQENNMKFNTGTLRQLVTISFVFSEQGNSEEDLESSKLLDLIILFRGAPFCAVQNGLLNNVYGIDALAMEELVIESLIGMPNAYRATLRAYAFNWNVYLDGTDFASMIKYMQFMQYLARGKERYLNRARRYSSEYPGVQTEFGPKNPDFDLRMSSGAPLGIFFDVDEIVSGASVLSIEEYLEDKLRVELDLSKADDINKVMNWLKGYGWDDEDSFILGPENSSIEEALNVMEDILKVINPTTIASLTQQIKAYSNPKNPLSDAEARRLAGVLVLQNMYDELANMKENAEFGDTLYDPKHKDFQNEEQVILKGLNLSRRVTVNGMSCSLNNILVHLPLQMAEGGAIQYMGGNDSIVRISLTIQGEEDLAKITQAFRLNQAIVRATKARVATGFIGMDSPLTVICGMRTFIPVSLKTSTIPGYPHVYSVSLSMIDFDLKQQEREMWEKQHQSVQWEQNWVGHPSLRLQDQGHRINLYPDLYVQQYADGSWEQPDSYFISTPPLLPDRPVANQEFAMNNLPPYMGLSLRYDGEGFVTEVNGQKVDVNLNDTLGEKNAASNAPQTDDDLDVDKNFKEMYNDFASSYMHGYMRKAFPTFFFAMIQEPQQLLFYRTYADFYARRGISSITVNRSYNPMEEVAIITITDVYRRASTDLNKDTFGARQGFGWWVSTIYKDMMMLFTKAGYGAITSVELQPGMRTHIRSGYSNNINDLRTIFNGTVAEVQPTSNGAELTLVAQGDGRELLGIINASDKGHDTADVSGLFYSEPRELIIRLMTMRSKTWRNALALLSGGAWHPDPKNGVRHFGELLPNRPSMEVDVDDAAADTQGTEQSIDEIVEKMRVAVGGQGTDFTTTGLTKVQPGPDGELNLDGIDAASIELSLDNDSIKRAMALSWKNLILGWDQSIFARNIYTGNQSGLLEDIRGVSDTTNQAGGGGTFWEKFKYAVSDALDFTSPVDEPSFKAWTYQRSVWDITLQCADLVPNYITAVRPFNHRSTLFYGKGMWNYTSGVRPVTSGRRLLHLPEDIASIVGRLGLYEIIQKFEIEKPSLSPIPVSAPVMGGTTGAEPGYAPITPGSIEGNWVDGQMTSRADSVYGTAHGQDMGKLGLGPTVSSMAEKYGIPWAVLMTIFEGEGHYGTQFVGRGQETWTFQNKNPGNLRFREWQEEMFGATQGKGGFASFPTWEAGIEACAYLLRNKGLNQGYYHGVTMIQNGQVAEGFRYIFSGSGGGYAPESENDVNQRVSDAEVIYNRLTNTADKAGVSTPAQTKGTAAQDRYSGWDDLTDAGYDQSADAKKYPVVANFDEEVLDNASDFVWLVDSVMLNIFEEDNYKQFFEDGWEGYSDNDLFSSLDTPDKLLRHNPSWDMITYPEGGVVAGDTLGENESKALMREASQWWMMQMKDFMTHGPGVTIFAHYLKTNGENPEDASMKAPMWRNMFKDFSTIALLEAGSLGLKVGLRKNPDGTLYRGTDGKPEICFYDGQGNQVYSTELRDKIFGKWVDTNGDGIADAIEGGFWGTPGYAEAEDQTITSPFDWAKDFFKNLANLANAFFGLFGAIGKFIQGVIQLGIGLVKQTFNLMELTAYMSELTKVMADYLLDSNYTWGTTDNPFSREFGEEVLEIREPFCKLHAIDSFHEIINNNIWASDAEVYPVVTSVSRGKKGKTVYADKSIAAEFQKEMVYENNLNFDILNFRDGIHAKRIGLAACARSLRTMYQGSIDIIGDPRLEPYDFLYITDAATDMWGLCQIREVTHSISAELGFVTQVSVMPIVAVDDPGQWAVTTTISDLFKRLPPMVGVGPIFGFFAGEDASLSKKYYGGEYEDLIKWMQENPDAPPWWYETYIGVGFGAAIAAIVIGVLTGNPLVAGLGAGVLVNPEKLAEIAQYFDQQQDVWISLLTRKGEPYQAGLTGSTGIVVGRQKSVGLDVLDWFAKDQPILSIDELLRRMGATSVTLKEWALDLQYFRNKAIIEMVTQDFFKSAWNLPPGGKWQIENVTVTRVVDGDTIDVKMPDGSTKRVRFNGVDAPESDTAQGQAARLHLQDLIAIHSPNGTVKLYIHPLYYQETPKDPNWEPRTLAWIECEDGTNLSLQMLTDGMAYPWGGTEDYYTEIE